MQKIMEKNNREKLMVMKQITIRMNEWDSLSYEKREDLINVCLDKDASVQNLAKILTDSGIVEIIELSKGLQIKTSSYVGKIRLGSLDIIIQPKISNAPFMALLRYAYGLRDLKTFSMVSYKTESNTFQDLLISQLISETRELVSRGLYRKYLRINENLSNLRGKVDFQKYSRNVMQLSTTIPCIYYPRLEDCLVNQILLAGLYLGIKITSDISLKVKLDNLINILQSSISILDLNRYNFSLLRRETNRLICAYSSAIKIIEILFESEGINLEQNQQTIKLPGFLFDMNKFFQSLLSRYLKDNLMNCDLKEEYRLKNMIEYVQGSNPKNQRASMPRPDFVIIKRANIVSIIDAKYRDLWENPLPREMLYQLAIYSLSQGYNGMATILYPTINKNAKEQKIQIQEPLSGRRIAYIILRPVDLIYLEEIIRENKNKRELTNFAQWLAFGGHAMNSVSMSGKNKNR